jgi:uncharacterized protein (TIGR04255 family)
VFDFLRHVTPSQLRQAPLHVAVAQIKFEHQRFLSSHGGASDFQQELADYYPRLIAEPQANITAGLGNVTANEVPQWRFTDMNNAWSCIVGPEHLAIETSSYSQWSTMRGRLAQAVEVLVKLTKPRIRERIGLRYINHIPDDSDSGFEGVIKPELLGVMAIPEWRDAIAATASQSIFRDGDTQLALRYGRGLSSDGPGANVFVLDIDCANETASTFDAEQSMVYFDQLNDSALRAFFASLAEPYRTTLFGQSGTPEQEETL